MRTQQEGFKSLAMNQEPVGTANAPPTLGSCFSAPRQVFVLSAVKASEGSSYPQGQRRQERTWASVSFWLSTTLCPSPCPDSLLCVPLIQAPHAETTAWGTISPFLPPCTSKFLPWLPVCMRARVPTCVLPKSAGGSASEIHCTYWFSCLCTDDIFQFSSFVEICNRNVAL